MFSILTSFSSATFFFLAKCLNPFDFSKPVRSDYSLCPKSWSKLFSTYLTSFFPFRVLFGLSGAMSSMSRNAFRCYAASSWVFRLAGLSLSFFFDSSVILTPNCFHALLNLVLTCSTCSLSSRVFLNLELTLNSPFLEVALLIFDLPLFFWTPVVNFLIGLVGVCVC